MEITLKRLTEKEILSFYKRQIGKTLGEREEWKDYVLPPACIAGLIAKNQYKAYTLQEGRKQLGCCFLIPDKENRIFLLHHFYIVEKYRGYNYSEILFELLVRLINHENKERLEPALGIFLELRGMEGLTEEEMRRREKEFAFYRSLGAYMTDILPNLGQEYNVLFLPIFKRLTREELKTELLGIYKEILPSFKDKKKFIKRLAE